MAKIDEVKEILNTLRLFFSIGIGLITILTGTLINKEQSADIDKYFWLGSIVDIVLMIGMIKIISSIKRYAEEIRNL